LAHDLVMTQFAIRCHPSVPVPTGELEEWLEQQVHALRADAPHGTVRLSRLTQGLPTSGDVSIGWLLEFELSEAEQAVTQMHVLEALRDMRLLGFQPTLLAPTISHASTENGATS
jgi:hypothetical protein